MAHASLDSQERPSDLGRLSDGELMERLKTASPEEAAAGFEILVRRYQGPIVSFLYRYVGDLKTAEDLAQEAFLRVYRKIGAYTHTAKFSTWLYTIASNLAKDEFKRRARHPAASLDWESGPGTDTTRQVPTAMPSPDPPADEAAQVEETRDLVHRALRMLRDEDREILLLKDVQGLAYEEIARVLSLPLGTAKSRIARARLAFKDAWKELAAGSGSP